MSSSRNSSAGLSTPLQGDLMRTENQHWGPPWHALSDSWLCRNWAASQQLYRPPTCSPLMRSSFSWKTYKLNAPEITMWSIFRMRHRSKVNVLQQLVGWMLRGEYPPRGNARVPADVFSLQKRPKEQSYSWEENGAEVEEPKPDMEPDHVPFPEEKCGFSATDLDEYKALDTTLHKVTGQEKKSTVPSFVNDPCSSPLLCVSYLCFYSCHGLIHWRGLNYVSWTQ